jgi:pyruvate-formate lyase-activating enzyme
MYYSAIAWPGVQVGFGMDVPHAWSMTRNRLMAEVYLPGCNLKCEFCVGPHLSRVSDIRGIQWVQPSKLVADLAGSVDVLLFTGGEATIHREYLADTFKLCRERGIHTGLESNGYMTESTAEEIAEFTDFIAIGLKASLDEEFYRSRFGVETGQILDAIKVFVANGCEVLVTDLTDPKLWEDRTAFKALTEWISSNLGSETRLVLSPMENEERIPLTPLEQREDHLHEYRALAVEAGLSQVFFQTNIRRLNEERLEHLREMGFLQALEQMRTG